MPDQLPDAVRIYFSELGKRMTDAKRASNKRNASKPRKKRTDKKLPVER